jgi:hypothetical protein
MCSFLQMISPIRAMSRSGAVLVALSALAACRADPAPSAGRDGAAAETAPSAPVAPPAPEPPAPVPVRSAVSLEPAGPSPLSSADENVVDPAATFRVELAAPLPDVRLVLLDERDALVPCTSSREVGAATALALAPSAPLVPASRYQLRLEGLASRDARDGSGRAFVPVSFALVVAGDPPPPPRRRRR